MKKLILVSLLLAATCTANVVNGPNKNGQYQVDQWGSEVEARQRRGDKKVQCFESSQITQIEGLKVKEAIAIF